MIILKHLTVENFRLLREIHLHFPQRGSILISGPNEAGKSTLFESIGFALYGESLALGSLAPSLADEGTNPHSKIDDLILYGEALATVTLTLSIGATELMITRTIERGHGQQVTLDVRRLGMPEAERITHLHIANERIINELGRIDGETLRNSCLIEQKGLDRVEHLPGQEREAALRKLLGLEKFMRLAELFQLTEEDERLLNECADSLKLAEVQARIPELSLQLGQIEAALDAVTVSEDLGEVSQQEAEIAEQQFALEQLNVKRLELKNRQSRIQQLKKADAILGELIATYDAIAEAQREIPELEHQVAELERREREELPALEQRVRDLSDLTRSFGTLERMAADLLSAVNTIKELEQELKEQQHIDNTLEELDEHIIHAHLLLDQAQQAQHELEEQHRSGKPQLEARLQRLRALSERLTVLQQTQEQYNQAVMHQRLSEENSAELKKVRKELQDTEQELTLVQNEAQQIQERADAIEKRWRQLSIRHQLEEWQRLSGLTQGLAEAEQHVRLAHQHQERLTLAALAARRATTMRMGMLIACTLLVLLSAGGALVQVLHHSYIFATLAGILAFILAAIAGVSLQSYNKTREKWREADHQMQEAISRVGMMVAARETVLRMGNNRDALAQVEHEIRSLGGTVPRSSEEAQYLLQQMPPSNESLADIQQRMTETHNNALASRNQVNVTMEAVAGLRKEYARLQELRKKESWQEVNEEHRSDVTVSLVRSLEQIRNQIITSAGQEGLPIPNFSPEPVGAGADTERGAEFLDPWVTLANLVADGINATEHEIAALDGKMTVLPDMAAQVKAHQDALDILLTRKKAILERHEQFQATNPLREIERAREQQRALRDALRNLQDSLRQRVQPLGVAFGQAAVNSAETAARKQLESLHITVGHKIELQKRHETYSSTLKHHQAALSDYYRQLAKYSSSLGGWIIPPNPFAEALVALRARCEREMHEANESDILRGLEALKLQEGASQAKIALCHEEIEQAHERIATMLVQRNRPFAKGYTFTEIVVVWPLVGELSPQDRGRLEEEHATIEQELRQLEQEEFEMSQRLHIGVQMDEQDDGYPRVTRGGKLDLEQAHKRMEQQERSYQTKKRGSLLITATCERIMEKMIPRTEYYMQQLLPLLTCGRYHDVRLTTETREGITSRGALQWSVWEPAANNYIQKSALSGGTADQISLALRLAFAIAALPRELSAALGLILVDDPLSSVSRERMQALVNIVTGEMLTQHFEQVLFASNSNAIDPAMFPYHIYIDDGLIVESNLPVVAEYSQDVLLQVEANANGHSNGTERVPVPASVTTE